MKWKQIVQSNSHSCNVSGKQLPIVPSETKDRGLWVSHGSSKNSGDALVRLNDTSERATDYDPFARYSELCGRNFVPQPCNQSVHSKCSVGISESVDLVKLGFHEPPDLDIFHKYFDLCARTVTTRAVVNEDGWRNDVSAYNRLKRPCYDTPLSFPLTSDVFYFKDVVNNQTRTPETDAFEKYSRLCTRNVTPRLAGTEDTSIGGPSSSNHLERTCYESRPTLPVVSEPPSFANAVNQATISETFVVTRSVHAITSVMLPCKRTHEDTQSMMVPSENYPSKGAQPSTGNQRTHGSTGRGRGRRLVSVRSESEEGCSTSTNVVERLMQGMKYSTLEVGVGVDGQLELKLLPVTKEVGVLLVQEGIDNQLQSHLKTGKVAALLGMRDMNLGARLVCVEADGQIELKLLPVTKEGRVLPVQEGVDDQLQLRLKTGKVATLPRIQTSYSRTLNAGHFGVYEDLGDCDQHCRYCGAAFWYAKRLKGHREAEYHLCCGGGRIHMGPEREPPEYIKLLFQNKHFMENIRAYNQMFAMTSFGAKIDESINRGRGPYVFKVSGQIYHWIGSMCPTLGEAPRFLQLYIYDTDSKVENRMRHFGGLDNSTLDKEIVQGLIQFLDAYNELVQLFRTTRDKLRESGFHTELKLRSVVGGRDPKRMTMLAYYRYQLHHRLSQYNLIFRGGRLFQQYVVGVFCSIEQNRLDFIRKKHNDIRSDYLSGLYDAISRGEREGHEVGGRIILPMSFTGGPRYMYAHYLDALAICRKLGNP
ncbi:DNA helicase [Tanacetum coccineum]